MQVDLNFRTGCRGVEVSVKVCQQMMENLLGEDAENLVMSSEETLHESSTIACVVHS